MSELDLHFVDEGHHELPVVVFLPAFPFHGGMWQAEMDALENRARRITFDYRGFGRSPLARAGGVTAYSFEHLVDDLFRVLEARLVERASLVGLSMGGYVALRAVERDRARFGGLFLADTQARADTDAAKLKRAEGVRVLVGEGVETYADGFLRGAIAEETFERANDVVERAKRLVLESSAEGLAAGLVALATRTDTSSRLAEIDVPTSVVVGEKDTITPVAVVEEMARSIPGADFNVLPRAGHLSHWENPEGFRRALLAWSERLER